MIGTRLDLAMAEAWPAAEIEQHGRWLLRFTEGVTRRANSVLCIGQPAELQVAIAAGEEFYSQRGLSPVFMVSDALTPVSTQEAMVARGYQEDALTWVVVKDLSAPSAGANPPGWAVEVSDEVTDRWFDTFWNVEGNRRGPTAAAVYRRTLLRSDWPTRFVAVANDDSVISVGQVVVVNNLACLQCLATAPTGRRRGAGTAVIAYLTGLAAELGARTAFAAVMADNAASLGLLERLDFRPNHQYRYLIR